MSFLLNRDLKYYGVNCDYNTEYSCEESGCNSEGICRCGKISNPHVTDVNISLIVNGLYNSKFDKSKSTERDNKINSIIFGTGKEIDIYCIDRILRLYKIYDPNIWNIDICGGYYGDEIGNITLDSNIASKIEKDINQVLLLSKFRDKVRFILNNEYGYILPEIEESDYEFTTINMSDVVFGSDAHYRKIQQENLDHYYPISYNGIRGIVVKHGDKYRIIDGYHRIYARMIGKDKNPLPGDDEIKVILANVLK
jgi:hypothetical protein